MPLILPGNVASATASTGYDIANSCRWNDGDSPSLKDGDGSAPAGNRQKFTWSIWFKRGTLGTTQTLGTTAHSSSDEGYFQINSDDKFEWDSTESNNGNLITNRLFRDCSAWYNVIVAVDTTQSTAANRMKIYVNGTQETSFATETYPDEDASLYWNVGGSYSPWIGTKYGGDYFDGYITEVANIDNAQLAATSFGEFDSDSPTIWKPIDLDGLTFGTAGYWLDMEDSSNFGNDVSGVGNHFGTVANLAAADQASDSPTNNFCTLNPLIKWYAASTMSEGSMKIVESSGGWGGTKGTMAVSKGKWYWEVKLSGTVANHLHGVQEINTEGAATINPQNFDGGSMYYNGDGGEVKVVQSGSGVTTTADYGTLDSGDILGIALNMDGGSYGQITFYDENAALVSNFNMSSDNAEYVMPFGAFLSATAEYNFGGCSAFALTSAANDENGYGNFEFAPPSGYYALCTKNLAEFG